jgi:hypothetical protein
VTFLRSRTASADTATLAGLAEALGDLPLALEQAAAYLDETQTTAAEYLALFREHGADLLALGEPLTTEQTVATTWQVALERVRATRGAQELLCLCAFVAPDNIPRTLLGEYREELPKPLRRTVGQPLALNEAVRALGHYSLVTVTADTLSVHGLVQTWCSPASALRTSSDGLARQSGWSPQPSHKAALEVVPVPVEVEVAVPA